MNNPDTLKTSGS